MTVWVHRPDHPDADANGMVPKDIAPPKDGGPYYMSDIAEFVSPVGYERITSRSQLREHERRHGIRQIGSDLKSAGDFAKENKRASFNERAFDAAFRKAAEKVFG